MNTKLVSTVTALALAALVCLPVAEANDEGKPPAKTTTKLNSGVDVKFDTVRLARSLVRRTVFDKNEKPIGYVTDLVIDCKSGYLAFVVVVPDRATNQKRNAMVLSAALLESRHDDDRLFIKTTEQEVAEKKSGEKSPHFTSMTADHVQSLHEGFGVKPYWEQAQISDPKVQLITLDELDDRVIRNADWVKMGRIDDVILLSNQHWRVGYVVLRDFVAEQRQGQRLAVPLSAFAVRTVSPTWLLDLDPGSLPATQTFMGEDWPHQIDRSWIKYVHVKYGAASLSGVQDLRKK